MKIKSIKNSEKFSDYELKDVKKLNADWFVYYYETGCYDGSGFAIWKKDGKYLYADLGHCSCYGPVEDLNSIPYDSLEDIGKFANKYNFGINVLEYVKSHKLG